MGALLGTVASTVLPAILGKVMGGGGSSGGGQAQQQQPQQPIIPQQMMPTRQMPSYSQIIQQMLSQQRGY